MVNTLIDKKKNLEDSVEIAADTIKQMSEYAAMHFKTEEVLMKEHNYPELSVHRAQHIGFREEIIKLGGNIVASGKYVSADIMEKIIVYLYDWWIRHILRSDMKYKQFFNDKGVY